MFSEMPLSVVELLLKVQSSYWKLLNKKKGKNVAGARWFITIVWVYSEML